MNLFGAPEPDGPKGSRVIGYTDGVAQNHAHPKTFPIPSELEKAHIKPGQYVKLGFRFSATSGATAERMWVKVTKWDGKIGRGELNNDPVHVAMKIGDIVKFESKHVLDILEE